MRFIRKYNYFKINESFDIFSKKGISKNDLDEIFNDLKDLGYKVEYRSLALTDNGSYRDLSLLGGEDYTPIISISLSNDDIRNIKNRENWSGGIYYTNNEEIISALYYTISTLKSYLKNKCEVFYHLDVTRPLIRLVFNNEKNISEFNINKFIQLIESFDDTYEIGHTSIGYNNILNLNYRLNKISINDIKGKESNKELMEDEMNTFINKIKDKIPSTLEIVYNDKASNKYVDYYYYLVVGKESKKEYFKIDAEIRYKGDIPSSKSIFKNKMIKIYSLEFKMSNYTDQA